MIGCALLCLSSLTMSQVTTGPMYELLDHPLGFGLRIDNPAGRQYFSMQGVTLSLMESTNSALISGTVLHQESGQLWDLSATFTSPIFINDGSEWRTNTSGAVYNNAIADLVQAGANNYYVNEMLLKNAGTAADRFGFLSVTTQFSLQSGQGAAVFTLPGQESGEVTLYDFPQGASDIPFMFSKGHRIDPKTNQLAGFGWLDARPPELQNCPDAFVQDFLFVVGNQVAATNTAPELTFTLDGGNGPTAGNITIHEGSSVVYQATGVDADAGDQLSLSISAAHLGGITTNAPPATGSSPLSDTITVQHFDDSGPLLATATITDAAGESTTINRNVTVLNVVPTLTSVEMDAAVRSGSGQGPMVQLEATDPGQDTVTFVIRQDGPASLARGGLIATLAAVPDDSSAILVEATGQTTPGSTRTASAELRIVHGIQHAIVHRHRPRRRSAAPRKQRRVGVGGGGGTADRLHDHRLRRRW